jgi:hypothetical protein
MHETGSWHAYRYALGFLWKIGWDRTQNYIYIRKLLRTQNYIFIRNQLRTQIRKTMKLYIKKQLDFGTQIYTQKYTKHYYLIKLKNRIRFWYTNIHTNIYKFLIKFFLFL